MKTQHAKPAHASWWLTAGLALILILVSATVIGAREAGRTPAGTGAITLSLAQYATGFDAPTDITFAPDSGVAYITEKIGTIQRNDGGQPAASPFLDITDRVGALDSEQGLLGLVFHPDFANNRYFYVNYTDSSGDTHIARFTASPDGTTADPNSEFTILFVEQPYVDHNAGDLAFGPEGYLYIPLGDGGFPDDPDNNAQDPLSLLGKILRIDVDGGSPYAIPADNPFVGDPGTLDEIWAIGFRNPWRISFDRQTNDLYIGDVGQSAWEEVDFQPAASTGGENYGWSCYEGNHPNPNTSVPDCGPAGDYVSPIFEYDHADNGCAITGGFVYRGSQFPALSGRYLATDYCFGYFWDLAPDGQGGWVSTRHDNLINFGYVTFGEDLDGELYVGNIGNGVIYQVQGQAAEPPDYPVFLPFINKPALPEVDLTITGLELTQAVQTPANDVPLVSGRDTFLRIFAQTVGAAPAGNVTLSIAASQGGSPLPGSPLILGPFSIPLDPQPADLTSTINTLLPAAWLNGSVDLTVTVDSSNSVPELDEGNNSQAASLLFNNVPALDLKIVPINYTHTPNSQFYPGPTNDTISDWVMRSYPLSQIDVSFRAAYNFSGNLSEGSEWERLLNELTTLKNGDGAPAGQVYYGLIPITNNSGTWFSSGFAGYAWIGWQRVATGLELSTGPYWTDEDAGTLAAHEIGHNFGRYHAPCGNPAGVDPNYPYPNASIGQFGLDTSQTQLWNPNTAKDVMSYCGPEWVSDYTYTALYQDQLANGTPNPAGPADSFLVRATVSNPGQAALAPIYNLTAYPTPAPAGSDYSVVFYDPAGQFISRHPVALLTAEDYGHSAQAIQAVVPRPGQPVGRLELHYQGQPIAAHSLAATPQTLPASLSSAGSLTTIRWPDTATPVMVRYSSDNGQSWTTLAFDVVGGELVWDLAAMGPGRVEIRPAH